MDTCAKCGAGLGVGRFCLNCGHRIGAPVAETTTRTARVPRERHESAAEAARRLQDPGRVPQPAPSAPAPSDLRDTDDGWFLLDDDGDEEPVPPNWWAWVLAALALVAAALLALSFLGNDDSSATDRSSAPAAEQPSAGDREDGTATPGGRARDVARRASVTVPATAPPTTDLDGSLASYDAALMVDGKADTAWRMAGDGTGAEITLTLAQPAVINRVGLVNGYAKRIAGVDWYPNNRRILGVRWTFEDGTSVDQTLSERRRLQRKKIDPIETSTVTLTITAVTPPGTGELGRDYTPISTVVVTGRPAG